MQLAGPLLLPAEPQSPRRAQRADGLQALELLEQRRGGSLALRDPAAHAVRFKGKTLRANYEQLLCRDRLIIGVLSPGPLSFSAPE